MEGWVYFNARKVFDEAIALGILSDDKNDSNFAGNFMYMGTKNGIHQFKNIFTRKYGFDLKTVLEATKTGRNEA